MEKISVRNFHEASELIGRECLFALNSQMAPLKCVVTGVDCPRWGFRFFIDLNVDPNVGEFTPGETRLSDVEVGFLFKPQAKESLLQALGEILAPPQM